MLTYHKKYKTTQHKIGERKESPQITINKKKKKKKFHHEYGFGLERKERGKGGRSLRSRAQCRSKKAERV